jgi:uncharacterized protein with ParB-like and HNH nuclease domain
LPAIQRDLVWETSQIERLFDSLMRDYPIGSFLFWNVEREQSKDFQFYDFIVNFHERDNKRIKKADISGEDDITAILDGQQRLTALYIGLRGTYAYKIPWKYWKNDAAFPKRKLYLNLLEKSGKMDLEYDFRFLTDAESQKYDENHYWFRVGEVLNFQKEYEVMKYLIDNELVQIEKEKANFANETLFKLFSVIKKSNIINYYLEKDNKLDKVLNIFIRVNSGGTPLNYSDLLLSIASTQWKEKDAREEIMDLLDEINNVGGGFNFNKDFLLKSCLVLSDIQNIAFKVDNFKRQNMLLIEEKWDEIKSSLKIAVELFSNFGFNRSTLAANNAVIPVAYYLIQRELPTNFLDSSQFSDDREKIKKWLNICLIKRTFGGQADSVLRLMRDIISENNDHFPFQEMVEKLKGTYKSLIFDDDEIENLFFYRYGAAYTFPTLALIYPTLDFKNKFHMDHIFPKSLITKSKLEKRGIKNIEFYLDNFNLLANLQLLEGPINEGKSNQEFKDWINMTYKNEDEDKRKSYMEKNFIPDVDLSFENFEEFIAERNALMKKEFKKTLLFNY